MSSTGGCCSLVFLQNGRELRCGAPADSFWIWSGRIYGPHSVSIRASCSLHVPQHATGPNEWVQISLEEYQAYEVMEL